MSSGLDKAGLVRQVRAKRGLWIALSDELALQLSCLALEYKSLYIYGNTIFFCILFQSLVP